MKDGFLSDIINPLIADIFELAKNDVAVTDAAIYDVMLIVMQHQW